MANDLTHHFIRSPVVTFGTAFSASQSFGAIPFELLQQLMIPLPCQPELISGFGCPNPLTLAFKQHCQSQGDLIIFLYGNRALGSLEKKNLFVYSNHATISPRVRLYAHLKMVAWRGRVVK